MESRKNCLTEAEAAAYIGMSRSFLRQSRMNGRREGRTPGPPFVRIDRSIRYLREDLDTWILIHRVDLAPSGEDAR